MNLIPVKFPCLENEVFRAARSRIAKQPQKYDAGNFPYGATVEVKNFSLAVGEARVGSYGVPSRAKSADFDRRPAIE